MSIDIYNNSCSELLQKTQWYCSNVSSEIFILIPEFIIYWFIASSMLARVRWTYLWLKKIAETKLLYVLIPYLFLRVYVIIKYDNIFSQYVLNNAYWISWIIFIFITSLYVYLIVHEEEDSLKWIIPKKVEKKEVISQENKEESGKDIIIKNIRQSLPSILSTTLYRTFPSITLNEDGSKKWNLFNIIDIEFLEEEKVFVKINFHEDLLWNIKKLKDLDWTTAFHSAWKLVGLKKATWKSQFWNNGLIILIEWKRISLKDILKFPHLMSESPLLKKPLDISLWKDETWKNFVLDLSQCPHLLVAGTTGWWKSVATSVMMTSLMKSIIKWEKIDIYVIDPKRVDYSMYKGLPNINIVNSIEKWLNVTKYLVAEMLRRYELIEQVKAKNIKEYNAVVSNDEKLWYKVLLADEVADLMSGSWEIKKDFEGCIQRLWQMARACWIHIILATQRPDKDIITGIIKANLPTVLWFKATTGVNSNIIIWDHHTLTKIKYKWEWYLKGWDSTTHLKTFYIDEKQLPEFVEYYKKETIWINENILRKSPTVDLKKKNESQLGLDLNIESPTVDLDDNEDKKWKKIISELEEYIDVNGKNIDIYWVSFSILREIIDSNWYPNRDYFFKKCWIYGISNSVALQIVTWFKSKDLLQYDKTTKKTFLKTDKTYEYLLDVYNVIYKIIQK